METEMSSKLDKLKLLYKHLANLGHKKEASKIPNFIMEDPMTIGFSHGGLNIGSFVESGDDEIDPDYINEVLSIAKIKGFGGDCAEAAIAIRDILFAESGAKIIAAVNKWKFKEFGEMEGHVAVEWGERYWDAEGEKPIERIESWGMLDETSLPEEYPNYDFTNDNLKLIPYEVEILYPTDDELIENFGGCNLDSLKRRLRDSEKILEKRREKKN
jgi:hypothetical protein